MTGPSGTITTGSPVEGDDDVDQGGTTVGAVGTSCRATVTSWGDVLPWRVQPSADAPSTLSWYVAAEDRWHVPRSETSVRQRRLDGTPVVETRVRVVDGDAVQRVWSVPDDGGLTIVEVENESPLPFAVAFAGVPVLTERPPSDVAVQGIDLPEGAFVLPVGHRTSVRVAIAHDRARAGVRSLQRAAPAMAVVRGWNVVTDRASRLVLPDEAVASAVVAARCDLLLGGPVEAADDPVGFLFDVCELVRLGEPADAWLPEIVEPVAAIARRADADVDRVLAACERMVSSAGDDVAAGDLRAVRERRRRTGRDAAVRSEPTAMSAVRRGSSAGRFVADVERAVADGGNLLPGGMPRRWNGVNFEVHRVPTGPRSAVSFAVRWHGERPAVLWEQHGDPVELRAERVDPGWATDAPSGEGLWAAPRSSGPALGLRVFGADEATN